MIFIEQTRIQLLLLLTHTKIGKRIIALLYLCLKARYPNILVDNALVVVDRNEAWLRDNFARIVLFWIAKQN